MTNVAETNAEMRQAVLEHMKKKQGKYLRADKVALALAIKGRIVSHILREYVQSGVIVVLSGEKGRKLYCLNPIQPKPAQPKFKKPFDSVYRYPIGMIQALERCKKDRGGEYHAVSMGGVGL